MSVDAGTDWLSECAFNLLVDYYPEPQFRPYGSAATRENVLLALQALDLGYICVYAKGHSGYTTWPSSLRTRHNMLGQDMPRLFRDVTREAGTRLFFYYSGLVDGIAGLRHPDWRMLNPDGSDKQLFSDFGFFPAFGLCPLSPYFDEWVSVQLRELICGYEPDGIWVDGDWPGPCYCPRCRARFREDSGWTEPWREAVGRADFSATYKLTWNRIEHEWRNRFRALVKEYKPDCLYSAGNVSPRRDFLAPFDWRSGDFFLPGGFELHDISRMMRWYSTLGVPYDAYVCDTSFTHARKHVRSRTKPLERMLQEAAAVAAGGGSVGYWTYPTPNGAFVPSRIEKARQVREFIRARESVFLHTQSAHWTGIVVTDPSTPTLGTDGVRGAHKALAALHRSPDVMDETGLAQGMPHDLLVLPEQPVIDSRSVEALEDFVQRGGKLLTSGSCVQSPALRELIGIGSVRPGAFDDGHVILRTSIEPTGIDSSWDRVELRHATELYPLYLSWDQLNPECRTIPNNWPMHGQLDEQNPEPAGCPAAVTRTLGQGRIVHICTDVFSRYSTLGDPQILRWLREIVDHLQPEPLLCTDAPSWVDVSLRRKGGSLLVHLLNCSPGRDVCRLHTDDLWADEIPTIGPLTCRLRLAARPAGVTWEPGGETLDWEWSEGSLTVTVPRLHVHGCVVVAG